MLQTLNGGQQFDITDGSQLDINIINFYKLPRASEHLKEPITYTNLSIKYDTYINMPRHKRDLLNSFLK